MKGASVKIIVKSFYGSCDIVLDVESKEIANRELENTKIEFGFSYYYKICDSDFGWIDEDYGDIINGLPKFLTKEDVLNLIKLKQNDELISKLNSLNQATRSDTFVTIKNVTDDSKDMLKQIRLMNPIDSKI